MLYLLASAVLLCLTGSAGSARDNPDLPLFELGFGAVARGGADYPGSAEYRDEFAAFPYIIYRGRLIEIGGEANVRFIAFSADRFEVGFTLDGSSALDSRDNALRGALPDLDALVEFGPELNFRLLEFPALVGSGKGRAEISLQTRGVFSFGDGLDHVGNLVRPALRYRQNGSISPGSRISVSVGPVFATEGVHDFFYSTPEYEARNGYLGTEITASFRYPLNDRVRLIGGLGLNVLSGSANATSPLFEEEVNGSIFIGLTVSLYQSKRRARWDR